MKVKELSRLTGIPTTKIRYYSHEGLIRPQRTGSNYREFNTEDALALYSAQMLRSFDIPLGMLGQNHKTIDLVDYRIADLEKEIEQAQRKLERLKVLREYERIVTEELGSVTETDGRVSYNIWNIGKDIVLTAKDEEELAVLSSSMPYSYVAVRIDYKSILDPFREPEVYIGLGMLESVIRKQDLDFEQWDKYRYTAGKGLLFTYVTKDPARVSKEELKPLLDQMKEYGAELHGDLLGRIYLSQPGDEGIDYYVMIGCEF